MMVVRTIKLQLPTFVPIASLRYLKPTGDKHNTKIKFIRTLIQLH